MLQMAPSDTTVGSRPIPHAGILCGGGRETGRSTATAWGFS